MKSWVIEFLRLAPGAILVTIGLLNLLSDRIAWLVWMGHAPVWMSALCIAAGAPYLSLVLYVDYLRRRVRRMRRANA